MQFDNVNFALDHHRRVDVTEIGEVISTWRSLFTTHLANSKVEFNRRQTNEVVRILVGVATLSVGLKIYYHIPRCINSLIINEML